MKLFRNKYQTESNRLNGWDYSSPGHYFVTICVKNMQCAFGQAMEQKMHYSPIGQIAAEEWNNTGILRSNIALDQWIVMPSHVHGIIQIKNEYGPPVITISAGSATTTTTSSTPTGRFIASGNTSKTIP